jgi:hypothetical protein
MTWTTGELDAWLVLHRLAGLQLAAMRGRALVERGRVGSGKRRLATMRPLTARPSRLGLAASQAFDDNLISNGGCWLAVKPFLT